MKIVNGLFVSAYYKSVTRFITKFNLALPHEFNNTRNLFLYFDYEREYSGQQSKISDNDVQEILKVLLKEKIKTTWFTVGKIFNKYPESVKAIVNNGHEIGSHTYDHISPLFAKRRELKEDFISFSKVTSGSTKITGFHSPRGQWCISMYPLLVEHGFEYDLSGPDRKGETGLSKIVTRKGDEVLRLVTIGDDWPLYKSNVSKDRVLDFFLNKINSIKSGELAGIGFHPWVILSNPVIYKGFIMFIQSLDKQKDIRIETAGYYKDVLKGMKITE